jgi:hypothetical protein
MLLSRNQNQFMGLLSHGYFVGHPAWQISTFAQGELHWGRGIRHRHIHEVCAADNPTHIDFDFRDWASRQLRLPDMAATADSNFGISNTANGAARTVGDATVGEQ